MQDNSEELKNLLLELSEKIYHYVFVRCGYNRELAEDLSQEIILKAWSKRDSYKKEKSTMKNWLYSIARNHITDYYRKGNKYLQLSVEGWESIASECKDNIEIDLELEAVMKALDQINPNYKDIILLRYLQELEFEEISKITNKSKIATKVTLHRAMSSLKNVILELETKNGRK